MDFYINANENLIDVCNFKLLTTNDENLSTILALVPTICCGIAAVSCCVRMFLEIPLDLQTTENSET